MAHRTDSHHSHFNNTLFSLQDTINDLHADIRFLDREREFLEDVVSTAFGLSGYPETEDEAEGKAARMQLLTEKVLDVRARIAALIDSKEMHDMHATFVGEGKAALAARRRMPGAFATHASIRLSAVIDGEKS